jgi:hypothetical protein
MKFFSRLFGGKSTPDKLSPDVEAIFEKLDRFLKTPSLQNESLPEALQKAIAKNIPCDTVPGADGVYGRTYTNPIPTNGPIGQALYLSSLQINGTSVMFHRLGSISNIDVFETVSLDGEVWDVLFLSLYFPRRSSKLPTGYSLDETGRFFGTTSRVDPFPQDLYQAVRLFTKGVLGMPLPNRLIREALAERRFLRPEAHKLRVDELVRSRMTLALTDPDLDRG